jgi:hypothetical protein
MKLQGKAAIIGLALVFVLAAGALGAAEKGFLWNGTQWQDMTPELKVAYVKGIGNMADVETAAGGAGRAACISKGFVDELKTKSVGQVIAEVDAFYKENPGKMSTPVIEVILMRCTKLCPPEPPAARKKK